MNETYWTYKASTPTPDYDALPEGCFKGTRAQWESLSPGFRREIARSVERMNRETGV